jgi:hypothetical protein
MLLAELRQRAPHVADGRHSRFGDEPSTLSAIPARSSRRAESRGYQAAGRIRMHGRAPSLQVGCPARELTARCVRRACNSHHLCRHSARLDGLDGRIRLGAAAKC